MDYRNLGLSGLKVSPICLGTMMFGDPTDYAESARIVASARDAGVNFIDTADAYAKGESEKIVGKLIAGDRDHWVLATKVGNPMGDGPNQRGTGRKRLLQAIDQSLDRLGTDYVDIYYLHKDFADIPLEETIGAMGDIVAAGKARFFGVSNFRGWRIAEVVRVCGELGVAKPVVCQPYYNAMNRQPEAEILPACHHHGIGVAPYSPLARGVLVGKYKPGEAPPPDTRAGRQRPADDADGVPRRVARDGAGAQGPCREEGAHGHRVRAQLGARQPDRDERHRGPADARAVGGLPGRAGEGWDAEDEALVDSMVRDGASLHARATTIRPTP